jgi:hypothetical protein
MFLDPDNEGSTNEKECFPEYFNNIVMCTLVQNFNSCPDFSKEKECKTLKKSVTECFKDYNHEVLVPLMILKGKKIEES